MARDAEAHAADDSKRRDEIDARNRADSMVYNVEKTLKEHRDKISPEEVAGVEAALEASKKAVQTGTVEEINSTTDALTQASHKLAEAMYKSPSAPPPQGGTAPGAEPAAEKPKDNVVDAEFVDVDDKTKK